MFVTILGSRRHNALNGGGVELFDMAAQGRLDAFFLGGGQIDGEANINLVGAGGTYPQTSVRWPGSFGSGYLYYLVTNVILFREEHTRPWCPGSTSVFARARGRWCLPAGRPRGAADVLCWFSFERQRRLPRWKPFIRPRHREIRDNTAF